MVEGYHVRHLTQWQWVRDWEDAHGLARVAEVSQLATGGEDRVAIYLRHVKIPVQNPTGEPGAGAKNGRWVRGAIAQQALLSGHPDQCHPRPHGLNV